MLAGWTVNYINRRAISPCIECLSRPHHLGANLGLFSVKQGSHSDREMHAQDLFQQACRVCAPAGAVGQYPFYPCNSVLRQTRASFSAQSPSPRGLRLAPVALTSMGDSRQSKGSVQTVRPFMRPGEVHTDVGALSPDSFVLCVHAHITSWCGVQGRSILELHVMCPGYPA